MTKGGGRRRTRTARAGMVMALAALSLAGCKRPDWAARERAAAPTAAESAAAKAQTAQAAGGPGHPPLVAWSLPLLGRNLREVFTKTGACMGNTDGVTQRYTGAAPGAQVAGWGWETAKKQRVKRVVLVGKDMTIVGAGEGGAPRGDVPRVVPSIADEHTGWLALTDLTSGEVDAYGVVGDNDAICPLGHLAI